MKGNNIFNFQKEEVLDTIVPKEKEKKELDLAVSEFLEHLNKGVRELKLPLKLIPGGSFAKNTYLKGDFDVDVFCAFQKKCSDDEKEKVMLKLLEYTKIIYSIKYGSRKYFQGVYTSKTNFSFNFECVPIQLHDDVLSIENSTDASIYHVDFFKEQNVKNPKLHDEVRLAKQWFKAKKLYGAESYIGGFSGHSIECLVIKLGSFENLIDYLSSVEKGSNLIFDSIHSHFELSKDKESPLIIQDPIIFNRNALSALGESIFYRAKFEAFLALKYGLNFKDFQISQKKYSDIRSELINDENVSALIIEFIFSTSEESFDSVGSKSKKGVHKVVNFLSKCGFEAQIRNFIYDTNDNKILARIEVENVEISKTYLRAGPSLELDKSILSNFLESNSNEEVIVVKDKLCVRKKREFTSIKAFANKFCDREVFLHFFMNKELKSLGHINLIYN